ncbi:TPA: hypothetical protein ACH3X2_012817 [Trebouxia sp. C0005]
MSALTLLHAGSAYSWYQADWDTNSGHLTGTFGEFGPGNFAVFVVAATTCLNAQLSVVSGSAPVFAYVMHQNDYDGWGSTTTYAGLTQGTPALPGTSCNVLAGETCDFAANSLDPSEGYVVLLANQNSGSTQASGSVTITSMCPASSTITAARTVPNDPTDYSNTVLETGGGYAEFPSITGATCLNYTTTAAFSLRSWVVPFNAWLGGSDNWLYSSGSPTSPVSGSDCTGTTCSVSITGLDPSNYYTLIIANPNSGQYSDRLPNSFPTNEIVDPNDYIAPKGAFYLTTGGLNMSCSSWDV